MTKIIDLSQAMFNGMPSWDISCGFHSKEQYTHSQHKLATHAFEAPMGIGTHIDAPVHFDVNGIAIDQLPFSSLIAPAIAIHWQPESDDDQFGIADLDSFEAQHGIIEADHIVLLHTGWAQYWRDTMQYRNVGQDWKMHFPTIHVEVAKVLAQRGVVALGIDTLSPDPEGSDFPLHRFWLSQNKIIIENLTNLDQLPTRGATLYALPLKIEGAAEAPARVIALM